MTQTKPADATEFTTLQAIALGGLVVGVLDLIDAFAFFATRGVTPIRILESIASGLLGARAFQGGAGVAVLGLALHFTIALGIVIVFFAAARALPALRGNVRMIGPLYGLVVYAVMNGVVIPLSAAAGGTPSWPVMLNGILIHMIGVGPPAVWFAQRAVTAMRAPVRTTG